MFCEGRRVVTVSEPKWLMPSNCSRSDLLFVELSRGEDRFYDEESKIFMKSLRTSDCDLSSEIFIEKMEANSFFGLR